MFGFEFQEVINSTSLGPSELGTLPSGDPLIPRARNNGGSTNTLGIWSTNYIYVDQQYIVNHVSEGFIGVEFDNNESTHFGWIDIDLTSPSPTNLQLDITGYAWESQAGVGIAAGAIPEPSTYALGLGLLALGVAGIRARRNKAA